MEYAHASSANYDFVATFPAGYQRDPEFNPIVLDPEAARKQFECDVANTDDRVGERFIQRIPFVPPERVAKPPEPKPPAPTDDWLARYVRSHGPLSIHRWGALFPRRSFRYAPYRFERLSRAERLTRAWMLPHIDGVMPEPLYYTPKPPKSRKTAMTASTAIRAITVPQAFGIVRQVAPEVFAKFKTTLAKLASDTRDKERETAIRFAADVVADADVSESSHAEVAERALTECLRRSLRYVAPDNIVQHAANWKRRSAATSKLRSRGCRSLTATTCLQRVPRRCGSSS